MKITVDRGVHPKKLCPILCPPCDSDRWSVASRPSKCNITSKIGKIPAAASLIVSTSPFEEMQQNDHSDAFQQGAAATQLVRDTVRTVPPLLPGSGAGIHLRGEHGTHVQLPARFGSDTLAAVDLTAAERPEPNRRLRPRRLSAKA